MPKTVYVLNGPNMNLLGSRQPEIYGRATIKDVAELAQVSLKTVSRVINNEPSVMEGTRVRVLRAVARVDIDKLKYFRVTTGTIAGVRVDVSRTGYTGDLGYEIWMGARDAVRVWDALMDAGKPYDIKAAGMLALDVARVEAGLLLIDVDFHSSKKALIASAETTR